MKKPNISIGELLALWDQFGPERQQNNRLAQAGQAIQLAQGAQQLSEQPGNTAARRAAEGAQLEAMNFQTSAGRSMLPGQIASQAAQLAATQAGTEAQNFQTGEGRAMAPTIRATAENELIKGRNEVAQQPIRFKREGDVQDAQIGAANAGAEQNRMQALSQLLASLGTILPTLPGKPGGQPGAQNMTPEIQGEIMAQLMSVPAIAEAFKKAGLVKDQLNQQQKNTQPRDFKSTVDKVKSNPLLTPFPRF